MWFTENPWPGVAFFLVLACFFLARGVQRGLARDWGLAGVMLVGALAVYLIEQAIVTPAEVVAAQVHDLLADCKQGDTAAVLQRISNNNLMLKTVIASGLALAKIHDDVRLTDVHVRMLAENSRAISHFRANGTISVNSMSYTNHASTRWELTWQQEGEQWKVIAVKRLNPLNGDEMGILDRSEM